MDEVNKYGPQISPTDPANALIETLPIEEIFIEESEGDVPNLTETPVTEKSIEFLDHVDLQIVSRLRKLP